MSDRNLPPTREEIELGRKRYDQLREELMTKGYRIPNWESCYDSEKEAWTNFARDIENEKTRDQ